MTSVMNIALSGIRASTFRAQNSANNISNANSSSSLENGKVSNKVFLPKDIVQIADPNGGTFVKSRASDKQPRITRDLTSGEELKVPDIDLNEELGKVQEASTEYAANLKVIQRQSEILGSLVNIFA